MIRPVSLFSPLIGRKIVLYDVVTSTNLLMKEFAMQGEEEGMVVVAETQTAGRGRRDRIWHSPRGKGLYLSILLRPALPPQQSGRISLMAAVAVVRTMAKMGGIQARIKWPNDIYHQGKKLGGILIENNLAPTSLHAVIVGIGLNVNLAPEDVPEPIRQQTTSLAAALGKEVDKDQVLHRLLKEMNRLYRRLSLRSDPQWLVEAWQQSCAHLHQEVWVTQNKYRYDGIFHGIDASGAALLELPTSATVTIQYGDCTLRMP